MNPLRSTLIILSLLLSPCAFAESKVHEELRYVLSCGAYSELLARPAPELVGSEPEQGLESLANKRVCLDACEAGGETLENFCKRLRTPRKRALCWAATQGSKVACIGMCNAIYK